MKKLAEKKYQADRMNRTSEMEGSIKRNFQGGENHIFRKMQ